MGSGKDNRKGNDVPVIRRPKVMFSSGIGVPDVGEKVAQTCIPSFEQSVVKTALIKQGVLVRLKNNGERYIMLIGENEIGVLTEKYSKMIKACSDMGVKYNGEIVEKNKRFYARFNRISR